MYKSLPHRIFDDGIVIVLIVIIGIFLCAFIPGLQGELQFLWNACLTIINDFVNFLVHLTSEL